MEWNDLFLAMAFVLAQKSKDESTKCGAIIVDKHNRIVSGGYNGFVRGGIDEDLPRTRPQKYLFTIHAEENSIIFANRDLEGAKCIVTNKTCHSCLIKLIQKGITEITYPKINQAKMIDKEQEDAIELTLSQHPEIKINRVDLDEVEDILNSTLSKIKEIKKKNNG